MDFVDNNRHQLQGKGFIYNYNITRHYPAEINEQIMLYSQFFFSTDCTCGKIVQKYARKQHAEVLHTCKKLTLYMTLFDLTSNLEIQEKLVLFL